MARCYGYLQSLMVAPAHRRQGIAARLMTAVEMRLQTWEFAGDPLPFCDHLGYRTLRRTLAREL